MVHYNCWKFGEGAVDLLRLVTNRIRRAGGRLQSAEGRRHRSRRIPLSQTTADDSSGFRFVHSEMHMYEELRSARQEKTFRDHEMHFFLLCPARFPPLAKTSTIRHSFFNFSQFYGSFRSGRRGTRRELALQDFSLSTSRYCSGSPPFLVFCPEPDRISGV